MLGSDPNTPYVPNNLNLYASINDPNDPETPTESFTYNQNHNLTEPCGTGVSPVKHTYDAENRLIEVVPAEDDPNNLTADDKKLLVTYDYLNRRVRKVVYAWDPNEGESGDWSATAELDLRFIYHKRLLLLELDGLDSGAKVRKHVWGPGSDGRLDGRNSLLAIRDVASTTNYVCFNNGTGSVAQLLDRSDGSVDAAYVYDTRGDTVRNTGTYAADNPLRCKAWYFDAEFDYAGTDCDGLYCAPSGDLYPPRLGRNLTHRAAFRPDGALNAIVELPVPDPPLARGGGISPVTPEPWGGAGLDEPPSAPAGGAMQQQLAQSVKRCSFTQTNSGSGGAYGSAQSCQERGPEEVCGFDPDDEIPDSGTAFCQENPNDTWTVWGCGGCSGTCQGEQGGFCMKDLVTDPDTHLDSHQCVCGPPM